MYNRLASSNEHILITPVFKRAAYLQADFISNESIAVVPSAGSDKRRPMSKNIRNVAVNPVLSPSRHLYQSHQLSCDILLLTKYVFQSLAEVSCQHPSLRNVPRSALTLQHSDMSPSTNDKRLEEVCAAYGKVKDTVRPSLLRRPCQHAVSMATDYILLNSSSRVISAPARRKATASSDIPTKTMPSRLRRLWTASSRCFSIDDHERKCLVYPDGWLRIFLGSGWMGRRSVLFCRQWNREWHCMDGER